MIDEVWTTLREQTALVYGAQAWGLRRTVGSCFFIEFGDVASTYTRKDGSTVPHGQYGFLVSGGYWRFLDDTKLILACEDSQPKIDAEFERLTDARVSSLEIDGNGDICLTTDRWNLLVLRMQTELTDYHPWQFRSGSEYWQLESDGSLTKE